MTTFKKNYKGILTLALGKGEFKSKRPIIAHLTKVYLQELR